MANTTEVPSRVESWTMIEHGLDVSRSEVRAL